MDIHESWRNCPWQYFRSFDREIIILSVFMAPDRVVLHASRNKSHREVVDMFSRGGRDCHFANTSVEMAKFVRAAVQLQRQCFINPWIQTALFLIIAIAATSAAVSWQFAGWISPIPPRLYSTAVNKVWCLQCGKCFSRNKQLFQSWIATVWGCIYLTKLRCPNIAHDPRCLKISQNTSIADPTAITRWPL